MSGDDRVAPSADPSHDGGAQQENGGLHRLMKALFELTPWGLQRRIKVRRRDLARLRSGRSAVSTRSRKASVRRRSELAEVRDIGSPSAEIRLDAVESALSAVSR